MSKFILTTTSTKVFESYHRIVGRSFSIPLHNSIPMEYLRKEYRSIGNTQGVIPSFFIKDNYAKNKI